MTLNRRQVIERMHRVAVSSLTMLAATKALADPSIETSLASDPAQAPRFFEAGGARLAFWDSGPMDAAPMLFIHGSWDDHRSWDGVVQRVPTPRRVTYDRRGHTLSSAPPGQGRIGEDIDDALALLDHLRIERSHVVGHSYGAIIAIGLTARHPERVETLLVHEPPLFGLLAQGSPDERALVAEAQAKMKQAAELLRRGETEAGARLFLEDVAFGAGAWSHLFDESGRRMLLANADTWLDQTRDPDRLTVDPTVLASFPRRLTVTTGRATLPVYRATVRHVADRLPNAHVVSVAGGHGAHVSDPDDFARALLAHLAAAG